MSKLTEISEALPIIKKDDRADSQLVCDVIQNRDCRFIEITIDPCGGNLINARGLRMILLKRFIKPA